MKKYIHLFAIAGNTIFALWIVYNGISTGFVGTPVEMVSYIGLLVLLVLNVYIIHTKK